MSADAATPAAAAAAAPAQPAASATAAPAQPTSEPAAAAPSRKLHAALFDIDGTLADTDVHHREVFRSLLAPHGIECDHSFFLAHISGRANALIAQQYLPHLSVEEAAEWSAHKEALFRERAAVGLEPMGGLVELLRALRAAGVHVAAVTNAPRVNVDMILRALRLEGEFETLVLGEECAHPKPHPEPYLEAMRRLAVQPENCVVFEDSLTGVRAGRASGAVTVGVRSSQSDEALRAAGAHCSVADFTHIDIDQLITHLADFHFSKDD